MKMHQKSSDSLLTLERALKSPAEDRLTEWQMLSSEALLGAGLDKAAGRLVRVLTKATRLAQGHWPRKRAYLYGYFFVSRSIQGHSGALWGTLRGVCMEAPWGDPLSYVSLGDRWGYYSE